MAVSAGIAGGTGAIGAVVGTALVVLVMGAGLVVLQKTAKSFPQLFQMMGLLLYTTQILFVLVFLIAFKDTTLFDTKAFAFTLLGTTLVWIAAQTRGHMKAKILYVDPDSAEPKKAETAGSPT
ncbi:putative ATP synthase accessory factor [Streptomyces sp. NBRC 110611]|nr:putative ATP synthase accessory factor [Streptomyces sp. NBRC 110611]